jgi:hypothetical protein
MLINVSWIEGSATGFAEKDYITHTFNRQTCTAGNMWFHTFLRRSLTASVGKVEATVSIW